MNRVRRYWKKLLAACVSLYFLSVCLIAFAGQTTTDGTERTMIICGAKVWENGPSPVLQKRIDAAVTYYSDHPDLLIIASGGRGSDEPVSEAECIKNELLSAGIPEQNIRMEDRSRNTFENLSCSRALLEQEGLDREAVVIVSNHFHLARIRLLAGRLGLHANVLGADMPEVTSWIKAYLREVPAWIKSFLFDRI